MSKAASSFSGAFDPCRRSRRRRWLVGLCASLLCAVGCSDSSDSSPFGPSEPVPVEPPRTLSITGPSSFSAVGQTGQLTANGEYADGIRDVSTAVAWHSSNPMVTTVSSNGLLTVTGFGTASIHASLRGRISRPHPVVAGADGTFTVEGRVREPGEGDIPGARILDPRSGRSTETGSTGRFTIMGVTPGPLIVEKEGYERVEVLAAPTVLDVPMQRTVRVTAGDSITPRELAPNDVVYMIGGERCFPCRLIRVDVPQSGRLQLSVTWAPPTRPLFLWTGAQRLVDPSAELSVSGGEVVIYVGLLQPPGNNPPRDYTQFTLSTSFR
jgi:hypothetical protein